MKARRVWIAMIAVSVVLAGGCASGDMDPPASNPTETSPGKNPLLDDHGIRPVRMATGRALSWLPPEAASQVVCQVLSKDQWERLLGGEVGRRPTGAPSAGCVVSSGATGVSLELTKSDEAFQPDGTVGGRPSAGDDRVTRVALTDDALAAAVTKPRDSRNVLALTVIVPSNLDAATKRDLQIRVLSELVPPLAKEGEPVPVLDDRGTVRYVSTPLTQHFVDLPTPIQLLQLCTILREKLDIRQKPPESDNLTRQECRIRPESGGQVIARLGYSARIGDYSDRIAGRPAHSSKSDASGDTIVSVLLRDDAQVDLTVSGPDAVGIVERLVPLLG